MEDFSFVTASCRHLSRPPQRRRKPKGARVFPTMGNTKQGLSDYGKYQPNISAF